VQQFFATATHPTLGVPYTQVVCRPMRELLALLGARDFTTYICSGGGRDFMPPVAEQMYGIPRERVIGSATTLEYRDGGIYRTKGVERPTDDGTGKPALTAQHAPDQVRDGVREPPLAEGGRFQPLWPMTVDRRRRSVARTLYGG
jgi:hypothetical protein